MRLRKNTKIKNNNKWFFDLAQRELLIGASNLRLREYGGQLRVCFNGEATKTLLKEIPKSGDQIILSLEGGLWLEDKCQASTPGKSIG